MFKSLARQTAVIALFVGVLFGGIGYKLADYRAHEVKSDAIVTHEVMPEWKLLQLREISKESRGDAIAPVDQQELIMNYAEVQDHAAFYEFIAKGSDDRVVLYCDAHTNSVNIGYQFGLVDEELSERLDGFSIKVLRPGSTGYFIFDEMRPALYDTHQESTYLNAGMKALADEDPEALVVFTLRYSGTEEESLVAGVSPAFKVRDVLAAWNAVPTSACEFVNLTDYPSSFEQE
ncbi:hypothetical protein PQC06_gp168 [Aeromonas phage LAh10]|uniref:Uncharacterized protein n=1 Tax=Aeromonas phage LAh10 TaxID=2591025 RepID=A0A514A1L8_9CAUD|nr:hypothetical protein PQC06_gp168 [Aeromonas phage LAh10]QDH47125.1 hypothetical protein LAh10_168 [Aeromonas phage LAh10]